MAFCQQGGSVVELGDGARGCTDAAAYNFDPLASVDDGSCVPKV